MVDVHGAAVVVLQRSADRYVGEIVQVQVRHGGDGGAKAGAAGLVFNPAAARVGRAAGLVDRLQSELVLKLAVLVNKKKRERMRDSPGSLQAGTRLNLHLLEPVDVDLPLLIFVWAHEHRRSDQEEIREGIPVHVQRLQHAAKVGPDLAESQNRLRAAFLPGG